MIEEDEDWEDSDQLQEREGSERWKTESDHSSSAYQDVEEEEEDGRSSEMGGGGGKSWINNSTSARRYRSRWMIEWRAFI